VLPAAERLRRDSLFQRTYSGRKSVSSPLLTLYVLPRQPRSARKLPLVGFVVGKKVHMRATRRNLTKRRVREAYRKYRDAEHLRQWYAMVWVVHAKALEASFEEICQTVGECITRAASKYGRKESGTSP